MNTHERQTKYFTTVTSEDGVALEAFRMLRQLCPAGSSDERYTLNSERHVDTDGKTFFWKHTLKEDGQAFKTESGEVPTVYVAEREKETSQKEGSYSLYLLFDSNRLSFFASQLSAKEHLLPLVRPLVRPTDTLKVEDVHTLKGRRTLRSYFDYGDYEESPDGTLEALKLFQDAPKELKLYALFDNFGELSLQEVKEALEAGDYDGGEKDGELVLHLLTGETYETEKKYLSALAELCGADVVEKYKDKLASGYRFYSASYFVEYLDYTLRQVEDYSILQKQEAELAKRYELEGESLSELGAPTGFSALDVALARWLENEYGLPTLYEGLSPTRIADYFRIPLDKLRDVQLYKDKLAFSF